MNYIGDQRVSGGAGRSMPENVGIVGQAYHQSGQLSQLAHQFGGMKERISAEIRRPLKPQLGRHYAPPSVARSTVDPDAGGLLAAP
jgi:hypothetical protein